MKEKNLIPFVNDMFALVFQAFKNLYPRKKCKCQWVPKITDENGRDVYGSTEYLVEERIFLVEISATLSVMNAVEVLAHELAHVAAGPDAEHGKEWEDAFDAIFEEYERLGLEMIK